jgi:hypothetical protein
MVEKNLADSTPIQFLSLWHQIGRSLNDFISVDGSRLTIFVSLRTRYVLGIYMES